MRWAGHVERREREAVYTGFWWGTSGNGTNLKDPNVDGNIILIWIFRMWEREAWVD